MMVEGLRRREWAVEVRELDGAFPVPTAADVTRAARAFAAIPDQTVTIVDGLALSALPTVIEHEAARLQIVALVHLPIAADVSLDPQVAARLEPDERRALAASRRIIVTGRATLSLLERYGISRDSPVVIEPGTERRSIAKGSGGGPLQLLCVATLQPGKGHRVLLEALHSVAGQDWHLTCAGSLTRDPREARQVRDQASRLGLDQQITFTGELDEHALSARYDGADVFVLATWQETWGMAVAEALAHGLPVVSTTCGALPRLVGDDAGLLVPPGDIPALRAALERVLGDGALRACLAEGARRRRDMLPTVEDAVARLDVVISALHANG